MKSLEDANMVEVAGSRATTKGLPARPGRRISGFMAYLAPREMVPFVARDYAILKRAFRMRSYCYSGTRGGIADLPAIFWGVLTSRFNYSWFAYRQAYWAVRFSRLMGRKSVVVLGGFDVCEEEDPRLHERIRELTYILRNADCLLAVSKRVRDKAAQLCASATRMSVVYHGFDPATFKPAGDKLKRATTIAFISDASIQRKGLRVFVEAASQLPDVEFVLIGRSMDDSADGLQRLASPNVRFTGPLPEPQLIQELQKSQVYVQASRHEGFGCSLAEAMLCECVPVVSEGGAIPEVVGQGAVHIDPLDPKSVAQGVAAAMTRPELGPAARKRVVSLFSEDERARKIVRCIRGLVE